MTEWRPFVVRRTTGGDTLREDDPLAFHAPLRYGAREVTAAEVAGTDLLTRPYYYDAAIITVQVPQSVEWERAVLVRGGFGAPTTPQDGIVIWYSEDKPTGVDADGNPINLSQEVLDSPLTPPHWYYYTLFLWVGNQWVLTKRNDVLVPQDHGWSDVLFNAIPPFYQRADNERAADGRNGALRKFARILGYDLDYTQCWADGVMNVNNVDRSPLRLVEHLGANMGFPFEEVLGGNRSRSVLEQLDDLNSLRGTRLGLERLVVAASDYGCDVRQGANELLTVDDGDFFGGGGTPALGVPNIDPSTLPPAEAMIWGIGHWEALTDLGHLSYIRDPMNTSRSAGGAKDARTILAKNTIPGPGNILTPPGGRGSMVVNSAANGLAAGHSVVICGHVSQDSPGQTTPGAMTSGVPVTPGALYEFSVQLIRTGWGAAGQQPPQARVIIGWIWWDADGERIGYVSGPAVSNNYDTTTWQRHSVQGLAPVNAEPDRPVRFATPFIWWDHESAGAWTGAATDVNTPPTYGRYVAMAQFGRLQVEGTDVVPISPDVYLTLGIDKLGADTSKLGEPS